MPILFAMVPAAVAQPQISVPAEPAQKLVADVIYNEMQDRERDSFWEYRSERLEAGRALVREQVETSEGPIFRVIEQQGAPLDNTARAEEEQRLKTLVEHPGAMDKVRKAHEADEERLRRVMEMLPKAFLFTYDRVESSDAVRIGFRPDPAFTPSGYEERIMHAMAGTITVNPRLKRMIAMHGVLEQRVDFGYGLLGHVDQGGTFEIGRMQVSAEHWKTSLVEVHVEGKILLFKDVTKNQRETRSEFHPVSHEITLTEAKQLLDKAAGGSGRELASVQR
ncbi:hypothetical protein [Silvibacterium dinghuense]|uniref:Uncharacterized protein n=1 Tax=Silvibacterium dinghuense TaxID=1560006 RepID=A0A4Q1SE49_9BACT|nr:hypothetical protein [Silvibacterium dinghuense]RXS95351.1 hypothetical protein ESZ00_12270 [Silvibacterium dinghuense]GGH12599.1 hypothetical protein GCM10011586_31980 [Silvibacterium dinghuense]